MLIDCGVDCIYPKETWENENNLKFNALNISSGPRRCTRLVDRQETVHVPEFRYNDSSGERFQSFWPNYVYWRRKNDTSILRKPAKE